MMAIDPYRRGGTGSFCSYSPGLYTEQELDDMIFANGYIPVATAQDLDAIRSGLSENMGGCTKWNGNYTTGLDKKYVQVLNVDMTGFGVFQDIGDANISGGIDKFSGVYDGNLLNIVNLQLQDARGALFIGWSTITTTLRNIRLINAQKIHGASNINSSALLMWSAGVDSIIEDCYVSGTITTNASGSSRIGGVAGAGSNGSIIRRCVFEGTVSAPNSTTGQVAGICAYMGTSTSSTGCIIEDCEVRNSTITGSVSTGGICGGMDNFSNQFIRRNKTVNTTVNGTNNTGGICGSAARGSIINNINNATVNGSGNGIGGIVGYFSVTLTSGTKNLHENANYGEVNGGGIGTGGIVGLSRYTVSVNNNLNQGNVNGTNEVGGISGRHYNNSTMENNYSAAVITGSTFVGGAVGRTLTGGTALDTYWDTDLGPATSAAGTGQTTSQLQTPTTNTGIYSAWTIPPWDFGTNNEYPTLTTTP